MKQQLSIVIVFNIPAGWGIMAFFTEITSEYPEWEKNISQLSKHMIFEIMYIGNCTILISK